VTEAFEDGVSDGKANGSLSLPAAMAVSVGASLLSDVIWYEIGRARGSQVTRVLCRISLEPDSRVRRSQDVFVRYGVRSLLVAKFVPGLNTVTQPLAGIQDQRERRGSLRVSRGGICISNSGAPIRGGIGGRVTATILGQ
jgi:hypothetical protein